MIRVDDSVFPSVDNWRIVINGMRNAYKSNRMYDSVTCNTGEPKNYEFKRRYCSICPKAKLKILDGELDYYCTDSETENVFVLGEKDKNLLLNLSNLGASDRKVLRQLPVILTITAPLFWWKEFDKYQIGTVTNSESTMHTLMKEPLKMEDFSLDALEGLITDYTCFELEYLPFLNALRESYIKTQDKAYELALHETLPQSYNQKRTWSGNYEVLVNYYFQRRDHKLNEHKALCQWLLVYVPYFRQIVEAIEGEQD